MASDDAKPASPPAAADPPAADAEDAAPADAKEETTPQQPEKKRGRRKKGEAQAEAAKKTPTPRKSGPAAERPSRERKTVERYSELAPRVTPVKKSPAILQVRKPSLLRPGVFVAPLICCFFVVFLLATAYCATSLLKIATLRMFVWTYPLRAWGLCFGFGEFADLRSYGSCFLCFYAVGLWNQAERHTQW